MLLIASDEVAEWGQKIVEVYMVWYTFFMTANLAIMGWFCSKDSDQYNTKPLVAVSSLFIVLNLIGAISTWMVAHSVGNSGVPEIFRRLILWSGCANITGLLGNVLIWVYIIKVRLTK
jgi:hypothetical protein